MDDDLGLNIVAVPATANAAPKKKKKNNKFEKRRRRAARERQAKEDAKRQQEQAAAAVVDAATSNAKTEQVEEVAANKIIPVRPREHLEDAYPEEFQTKRDEDDNAAPLARSTAHLPQDEQERAAYLAEFHARPLELDRRAGALRKVTPSKHSAHLFDAVRTWTDCGLSERLVHAVQSNSHFDLAQPTMIQAKAIPAFLKFEANILLHSETGSGKTLAYLLPIVQALAVSAGQERKMDRQKVGTRCLILCPTRELASQTFQVVERLCSNSYNWLVPGSLLGEENRKSEKARLRKGLAIIVATPGRLLDHLQKTESLLMALKGKLEWLVLDEADRLLDMGLGGQVKQILQRIRSNQPGSGPQNNGITWRSVLVSATVTNTVQTLAKETMVGMDSTWEWVRAAELCTDQSKQQKDFTVASETSSELATSTPRQLSQAHMTVSAKFRLSALIALLVKRVEKKERAVVFFNTCASVDYHHALLTAMDSILDQTTEEPAKGIFGNKCRIFKLHGSVSHTDRQQTMRQFLKPHKDDNAKENGKAAILLATDVAARGLNLQNCDWTIQYDPPSEVSDYVHRAGRVARAGRAGHSLLFLLPSERSYLDVLKQRGIKHLPAISLASTLDAAAKICSAITKEGVKHSGGGLGQSKQAGTRSGEAFCSELQRRCELCVKRDDEETRRAHQTKRKEERKAGIRSGPVNGELLELARAAFLSHIRAYPTREKAVKHIFSARALHLGHVARAFALSEPPKRLASKNKTQSSKHAESENKKRSAALAFQDTEDGQEEKKTESSPSKKTRSPHEVDTRGNRALMIANASKLNGLDSL